MQVTRRATPRRSLRAAAGTAGCGALSSLGRLLPASARVLPITEPSLTSKTLPHIPILPKSPPKPTEETPWLTVKVPKSRDYLHQINFALLNRILHRLHCIWHMQTCIFGALATLHFGVLATLHFWALAKLHFGYLLSCICWHLLNGIWHISFPHAGIFFSPPVIESLGWGMAVYLCSPGNQPTLYPLSTPGYPFHFSDTPRAPKSNSKRPSASRCFPRGRRE